MEIHTAQWKAGQKQAAASSLAEALDVVDREPQIPPGMSKPMPVAFVYSHRPRLYETIIYALAVGGEREEAGKIVRRISELADQERDSQKRQGILGQLAIAKATIGEFSAASKMATALEPGIFGRDMALEGIAREQARRRKLEDALATVKRLPEHGTFVLDDIARLFADAHDYKGARAVIERMKGPEEKAWGFASLALEQVEIAPESARTSVALAWGALQNAQSNTPSLTFQNALEYIAGTRALLGDMNGALEIIDGTQLQRRLWPLECLVQKMTETGHAVDALRLARSQNDPNTTACLLNTIAETLMDEAETANKKTGEPR
ncbi:MAG TPA: hypothetical protein VMB03_07465 [Bryobacteraceae bacterium]|nr:hypothetical protein [Bryobacteraceae bacterium]